MFTILFVKVIKPQGGVGLLVKRVFLKPSQAVVAGQQVVGGGVEG